MAKASLQTEKPQTTIKEPAPPATVSRFVSIHFPKKVTGIYVCPAFFRSSVHFLSTFVLPIIMCSAQIREWHWRIYKPLYFSGAAGGTNGRKTATTATSSECLVKAVGDDAELDTRVFHTLQLAALTVIHWVASFSPCHNFPHGYFVFSFSC